MQLKLRILIVIICLSSSGFSQSKPGLQFRLAGVNHYEFKHHYVTKRSYLLPEETLLTEEFEHHQPDGFRSGMEASIGYKFRRIIGLNYYFQVTSFIISEPGAGHLPFSLNTGVGVQCDLTNRMYLEPRVGYSSTFSDQIEEGIGIGLVYGVQVNKAETFFPFIVRGGFYYCQRKLHTEWYKSHQEKVYNTDDRKGERYTLEICLALKLK